MRYSLDATMAFLIPVAIEGALEAGIMEGIIGGSAVAVEGGAAVVLEEGSAAALGDVLAGIVEGGAAEGEAAAEEGTIVVGGEGEAAAGEGEAAAGEGEAAGKGTAGEGGTTGKATEVPASEGETAGKGAAGEGEAAAGEGETAGKGTAGEGGTTGKATEVPAKPPLTRAQKTKLVAKYTFLILGVVGVAFTIADYVSKRKEAEKSKAEAEENERILAKSKKAKIIAWLIPAIFEDWWSWKTFHAKNQDTYGKITLGNVELGAFTTFTDAVHNIMIDYPKSLRPITDDLKKNFDAKNLKKLEPDIDRFIVALQNLGQNVVSIGSMIQKCDLMVKDGLVDHKKDMEDVLSAALSDSLSDDLTIVLWDKQQKSLPVVAVK